MAQRHRLKIESSISHAQRHNLAYVALLTSDVAELLGEFHRLRHRMVKSETELQKLRRKTARAEESE